jgi:hypothetical protein
MEKEESVETQQHMFHDLQSLHCAGKCFGSGHDLVKYWPQPGFLKELFVEVHLHSSQRCH